MPLRFASRRGALRPLLAVLPLETVDAAGRVDQLLLAGEEGVALRADLDAQLLPGRAGGPGLAAGAVHLNLVVLGMDLCFHELTSSRCRENGEYSPKILVITTPRRTAPPRTCTRRSAPPWGWSAPTPRRCGRPRPSAPRRGAAWPRRPRSRR